jgi:hypothetical protein
VIGQRAVRIDSRDRVFGAGRRPGQVICGVFAVLLFSKLTIFAALNAGYTARRDCNEFAGSREPINTVSGDGRRTGVSPE